MKLDLNKLEAAHSAMAKIITVCKSGVPTPETIDALSDDLNAIYSEIGGLLGDNANFDKVGLRSRLGEATTLAESLSSSTHDLNVQDQLDSLLEKIKEINTQLDALPETTAPVAVAAPTAPATEPVVETAPAPVAATPEVVAAPAPEATPVVEAAAPVVEPVTAPVADVVTKSDLADFSKTIADSFKSAIGELTTTLKVATPTARGVVLPPAGQSLEGQVPAGARAAEDSDDGKHWGNHFDLNDSN